MGHGGRGGLWQTLWGGGGDSDCLCMWNSHAPTFNMTNYPSINPPKWTVPIPYELLSTVPERFQILLLHYPFSIYVNSSTDFHSYIYIILLPTFTPPSNPFARVMTRSTSKSGPLPSCVPTNAKVGGWDLKPDLNTTTKIVCLIILQYFLYHSVLFPKNIYK